MKTVLAIAALAVSVAALTGCSTSHSDNPAATTPTTDMSDEAMAREFALSVDGISFDTIAHPDDFVFGVAQTARSTCSGLDSMSNTGGLPETPNEHSKAAFAAVIQSAIRDNGLTDQQQRNKLWVSAKYRCPQYSAALGAHFDAVPVR